MIIFDSDKISIIQSLKSDGDLVFKTNDSPINSQIRSNRETFFKKENIDPSRLININAAHGNNIFIVEEKDFSKGALVAETRIENCDGLLTNIKNSYLSVTGADCFPVCLWDKKREVIAITHNGYRGILAEIVPKTIKKMGSFGSKPTDINIWIGPGIRDCHFSVTEDRADLFSKNYKNCIIDKQDQKYINLTCAIKKQLANSGIQDENIIDSEECTFCDTEKYFSYRRDHPEFVEAQMFIIHLK